ncbi:PREDICTED: G patch domain-containing protein TGH-like [Camelina sativa]|uniref:G patch domain-containing protein TGH-like n=1 Tax=Camelina sativa TaxID=90675 RepID=A0ABM0VDL3_CAMSA|nr:PREDICTED: G patch domain-containing protein TGH-like [Camelina sativa]
MASDEEDFVFHGTPIEREEEIVSRKKKAVAGASGNLRTLPAWKQEVTDEEGRRRFHGAFTGGYSAGYYNTVGSKDGWAPQSFTSSRKNRAGARKQSISDFLDEDEKADMEGQSLSASSQFDTFGFTAAEYSRKQVEKEQHERPSAIPGPVPDELIAPVSESIGVKLLLKMGWRRGHSIKDVRASSDARREARKAFLAFSTDENTKETSDSMVSETEVETSLDPQFSEDIKISESIPVYVLNPKQDLHGLGYDPFKHAPEFREKKRSRLSANKEAGFRKPLSMKESLFGPKSGKTAPGFGIGALEELDVEDEDVYGGYDFDQTYVIEDEQPAKPSNDNRLRLTSKEHDVLPGFGAAKNSDYSMERFNPPTIPKDFVARHKFAGPLEAESKPTLSAPPDVPPPADNNLKLLIEGFATFVSRCGKLYEDLSREKNQSNQLFDFLRGGNGHEYYARRLWEEQQKRSDQSKLTLDVKPSSSVQKMTAEERGSLLGEKPLQRSLKETDTSASSGGSFQFPTNLSDTFTKSASTQEAADAVKPFKDDPAKQERFEQFLKEKYKGGLRSTDFNRVNSMSESARAQERLDFEAAAEAIEKGKAYKEVRRATERPLDFLAGGLQFTSGGTEQIKDTGVVDMKSSTTYPKREEFQWRPSPLLCKRFDLPDPFMGKLPPAPRARNKMDSLIFLPDTVKAASAHQVSESQEHKKETSIDEPEVEVEVENVERPVDLYKAIFSDDSEDDEDHVMNGKIQEGQEKKNEAAASTLNRLIAGDFLESLGKELGFEVPSDVPYQEGTKPMEEESKSRSKPEGSSDKRPDRAGFKQKVEEKTSSLTLGSEEEKSRKQKEKSPRKRSGGNDLSSSESSGDERSKKRSSKKDRYRNNDSESDSSSDYHSRDKQGSRSRRKRRESSREKRSSHKKHSKHHRSKKSSSSKLVYSSDEDRKESKREKRRRRD